ncbi:MAG TPA: alanine:cation symporter family protein, partial [Leptospiraceae bacterium]|nr:alanine:cation symporter family protein [Leptospiraceae bacterium]
MSLVLFFAGYFSYFRDSLGSFTEFIHLAFVNSVNMESIAAGGTSGALILIAQSSGAFLAAAETGIGKSAGISGVVRTDYPFKHGLVSMLSIFFEAFIIATLIGYLLYSNNAVNTSDQSAFLNSIFRDSRNPGAVLLIASFLSLGMNIPAGE